jgi:hypothetical protein
MLKAITAVVVSLAVFLPTIAAAQSKNTGTQHMDHSKKRSDNAREQSRR